jgi:hypothetical protein
MHTGLLPAGHFLNKALYSFLFPSSK